LIDFYQHQVSSVHQANTRVKSIFTLVFVLCISLSPSGAWPAYILFLTVVAVGIILSRLSIRRLLIRSLISLPFVLAAFPLLFTGPEPRHKMMISDQLGLLISQPGMIRFVSIAIKSWLSLMAAILLSSTTRFEELLSAFRQLGLPKLLVAILSLMWRYLSLMVDEARSLSRARDSRSAGQSNKGTLVWRAGVTGKMVGNLLLRSLERSERVYAAMSARGYSGEPPVRTSSSLTKRDFRLLAAGILLSFMILAIASLSH
jgi:cobalt/nickel transport system permease protein